MGIISQLTTHRQLDESSQISHGRFGHKATDVDYDKTDECYISRTIP